MVLGTTAMKSRVPQSRGRSPDVTNTISSTVLTPVRRAMTGRVPSPYPQTQLPALSILYRGRPAGSSGSDSDRQSREYSSSGHQQKYVFDTPKERQILWCRKCDLRLDELKDQAAKMLHNLRVQASRSELPVGENLLIKRLHEKLNSKVSFGGGETCQLIQGCCRDCHTHLAQLKHVAVAMVQNVTDDQPSKMSRAAVPPSRLGTPTPNSRPPTSVVRPMAAQPLIPRSYELPSRSQLPAKKATHHHVHHHLHQHHHQSGGTSKIPTAVLTPSPYSEQLIMPVKKRECEMVSRPVTFAQDAIKNHHQLQFPRGASPRPVGMCPGSLTSMVLKRGGNSRNIMTSRQSKPSSSASPATGTAVATGTTPTSQSTTTSGGVVPTPVAQQAQQYLEQNIQAWMQPKPHHSQILTSSLTSMVSPRGTQSDDRTSANGLSPSSSTGSSAGGGQLTQDKVRGSSAQLPASSASGYSSNSRFYSSNLSLVSPGQTGSVATSNSVAVTSMAPIPGLPTSTSFPHSLSFSGYSQASALQGTSFSSPCASSNYVVTQQPSAAASFFARAAQRLNLSSKKRRRHHSGSEPEPLPFRTNFSEIVKNSPPPAPPALLRGSGRIKDSTGLGKVKVMLRICHGRSDLDDSSGDQSTSSSFLNVDQRKKQLSVFDPSACGLSTPADRRVGVSAPKMFAFDAIFSQDDTQTEVCSSSLTDVIQAVVNGNDGCLFVYGHSKLGKTYTMTGGWSSPQELGVIPCSLCWLFRLINEQKQRTGARFSVRVSAVEITGKNENLRDLLSDIASGTEGSGPSPAIYLRDDPIFGTRLMNHSELRAPTAEKAAFLLDAALAARSVAETDEDSRNSHFLFTLHVYQYRVEKGGKGGVAGGRSRLHLFDLGSCEKQAKPREGGVGGQCLTLSALGNVILALFNGQKHVPCKDSKVTQIMREALGSLTCRAAMIAHVSSHPSHYAESLSTIQLASRVHRMRRKKLKYMGVGTTDTVDDKLCRPFVRSHAVSDDGVKSGSSDPDYTSSSEQSCDTVIYVGAAGLPLPERDLTDNEGPPPLVPPLTFATPKNVASQMTSTNNSATIKGAKSINNNNTPSNADHQVPKVSSAGTDTNRASDEVQMTSSSSNAMPGPAGKSASVSKRPVNRGSQIVQNDTAELKNGAPLQVSGTPRKSGGGPKRTQNSSAKAGVGQQGNNSSKLATNTKDQTASPVGKDPKIQSDELWIDGPRFCKPRFDSRTLHQLQKEQWVDGPAVNYGYMDDHKQDMILKWVEEHSKHAQSKQERMKEVWIDFPRGPVAGPGSGGILVEGQTGDYHRRPSFASHGDRSHRTSSSLRRAKEDAKRRASAAASASQHHSAKEETSKLTTGALDGDAVPGDSDDADSASTSADIDDGDNELGNMANDLEDDEIKDEEFQGTLEELEETLSKTRQVILEYAESDDDEEQPPETIEVMDPEEPVQMTDSCLQVNEEDIMAACWMLDDASENPLPEVDQESLEGSDEHPLRILSREGLNLASSFTDSRSVSVDLETMSVPDDTPRSWRDYVRGPTYVSKLRDPASFAAAIRLTDPDETSSVHSSFRSELFSQKLERIARLREISLAAAEGTKFSDRASDDITFSKTSSTPKLNSTGLPSRTARLTMSDMLFGSRDSSLDEMVEDVTSIHSEPAELDFDRCDYKFNIKPMNGLKLEAFYNKLYNTTSFLEQALQAKSPSTSLLNSASRIPSATKRQVVTAPSPSRYAVPKIENAAYQRSSVSVAPVLPTTEKLKTVGSCRNLSGNVSDTGGEVSDVSVGNGNKRNSLDERKRRSYITSLRHPDGASNPHLNKHPSITQISPPTTVQQVNSPSSVVRMVNSPSSKSQRSPGSGACSVEADEKPTLQEPAASITYQMEYGTPFQYEKQTLPILTPGQSPTAKMSRLSRLLGRSGSGTTINSEKTSKSKESSSSKHHKSPKSSPKMSSRSTPNASPSRQQHVVGTPYGACSPAWIPTRGSPTSSSTGVPTMCCNSMKAIGGRSSKNKQSTIPSNGSNKHSPKIDKQQRKAAQAAAAALNSSGCGQNGNCCSGTNGETKEHKKAQKSKILARSSSSPVTSCDEKETLGEERESEEQPHAKTPLIVGDPSVRKRSGTAASSSSGLPSPYSLITKARLTHHSSSGHGSDSSVNSGDLRDGKEPLMKGMKGQQCSGTSSGYESILRDSEGTPLSSSSQESECEDLTAEGRGRKGKRKKSQGGSTKRSRSAPARVPNGNGQQRSPGASGNGAASAFIDQPRATANGRSGRHHHHIQQHWGNGRLRTSEDDVCCTGLLCCRLLDFY